MSKKFKLVHDVSTSGLNKKLEKIIKNTDLTQVMDAIGLDMRTQTQLNFRKKRDPDGNDWPKYAKSTEKAYKSKGRTNPQLLQNRRNLRKSVDIYTSNKNSATISTNLKYAATHQYGDDSIITRKTKTGRSKAYSRNIPERPYIGITQVMVRRYNKMVRDYIVNGKF